MKCFLYRLTVVFLLSACTTVSAAKVTLEYINTDDEENTGALLESGVLEEGVELINEFFDLHQDITVIVGTDEGPLYDPSVSEIHIPWHFYLEVIDRISALDSEDETQHVFASDAMLHTLYHELGHALIDQLDIPVVGKEEDAVDALASMLLIEYYENGAAMAVNAAELFALESEDRGEIAEADFWGEHSLDEQRYYSTLCHVVGSDPDQYQNLADDIGFSSDRVELCEETYRQMVVDWEVLLEDSLRH